MSMQEWAIRKVHRDHQRQAGEIAMLKGEAERTRAEAAPKRIVLPRDLERQV